MLRLKARLRKWLAERKLKKSGYETWSRYRHNRDPDVQKYANHLDDFYFKYPYVYACTNPDHYAYELVRDYGPGGVTYGYEVMYEWCEQKIRWNYRVDIHRVWQDQWGKYSLNDIGGGDIIFFAFKREQDFTYFLLRWS